MLKWVSILLVRMLVDVVMVVMAVFCSSWCELRVSTARVCMVVGLFVFLDDH